MNCTDVKTESPISGNVIKVGKACQLKSGKFLPKLRKSDRVYVNISGQPAVSTIEECESIVIRAYLAELEVKQRTKLEALSNSEGK